MWPAKNSYFENSCFKIQGPDITIDEKSFLIHHVLTMDVLLSVSYLYPRVFALHEIEFDGDETKSPPMVRGQFSKIMDDGIYLLGKLFCLNYE